MPLYAIGAYSGFLTSGVTKGPADPAVRGGAILGGAKSLFEYGTIF